MLQRSWVFAGPYPIYLIIAAHHRANTSFNGSFERWVVHFVHGSLVRNLRNAKTVRLLVVQDVVFGVSNHTLALDSLDHRFHERIS